MTATTPFRPRPAASGPPRPADRDDVPIRLRQVHVLPHRPAVRDTRELTVGVGEAVAGPAGSGKTALVDLLLVLDDPTAELDGADLARFGRMARAHAEQGRTAAITCRRLIDAAACADRLLVLEQGRVVADSGRGVDRWLLRSLRRITARVAGALPVDVRALPAVCSAVVADDRMSVLTTDGDATLRALLVRYPQASSISIVEPTLPDLLTAVTGRAGEGGRP